ncbi:p53-like transcription factor [Alternaria alternata]|nr:p53-like transcription factor [Alternaria alternata]
MAPAVAKGFAADRLPLRPNCFAPSLKTQIRPGESVFRVAIAMLRFGVPSQASKGC